MPAPAQACDNHCVAMAAYGDSLRSEVVVQLAQLESPVDLVQANISRPTDAPLRPSPLPEAPLGRPPIERFCVLLN